MSGGGKPGACSPSSPQVLRLKLGYNPNSSSLGSVVFGVPTSLLAAAALLGAAAGAIAAAVVQREPEPHPAVAEAGAPAGAEVVVARPTTPGSGGGE